MRGPGAFCLDRECYRAAWLRLGAWSIHLGHVLGSWVWSSA